MSGGSVQVIEGHGACVHRAKDGQVKAVTASEHLLNQTISVLLRCRSCPGSNLNIKLSNQLKSGNRESMPCEQSKFQY